MLLCEGQADLSAVPIVKGHYTDGEGDMERIWPFVSQARPRRTGATEAQRAWFVYGIGTGLFSLHFEPGLVNFMANKFHSLPFSHVISEGFIQSKVQ